MLVLLVLDLRRIDKAVEKAVQAATASMAKHLTRIQEELAKVKEELADERCRRINIEGVMRTFMPGGWQAEVRGPNVVARIYLLRLGLAEQSIDANF